MRNVIAILLLSLVGTIAIAEEPAKSSSRGEIVSRLVQRLFGEAKLLDSQARMASSLAVAHSTPQVKKVQLLNESEELHSRATAIRDKLADAICMELDSKASTDDKDSAWQAAMDLVRRKSRGP